MRLTTPLMADKSKKQKRANKQQVLTYYSVTLVKSSPAINI